jgi:hypothetical protein
MSRSWILAFVLPLAAAALAADAPATPRYFKPAEVDAARARGETGSMLIEDAEYKVLASRRDKPGQSEVHVTDTDIFVVIGGQATIVLGGRMIDAKETAPASSAEMASRAARTIYSNRAWCSPCRAIPRTGCARRSPASATT